MNQPLSRKQTDDDNETDNLVNKQSRFTKLCVLTTTNLLKSKQHGVSAAKDNDDNDNPDLLNQVVRFTTSKYLFAKVSCLLL